MNSNQSGANRLTKQKEVTMIGNLMKIKQNYLTPGLVLAAVTLLALGHPAMAGDQVPYKGKEVGFVTKGAFQFPFAQQSTVAEGEATHLGHYTLAGDFVVDVRFGTATGVATLTAANGDMLFLTMQGHAIPTDLTKTVANYTITGGTGRFEGATGSFTADNQFDFAVNLPVSPNRYVAEIEGTISTVGSNKK
jgi:hypothetical protein